MKTSLPEFIAELGDEVFAKRLAVPLRTVESWRRRERFPRVKQAQAIVELWPQRLSFDSIYGNAVTDGIPAQSGVTHE